MTVAQNTSRPIRIYSPTQVACGTIGGPVGLIYFLRSNFIALGNKRLARKTLVIGSASIATLIAITPLLPEKGTSFFFTAVYILTARHVSEKYQLTKDAIFASNNYTFQSSWRVLLLGLLCLVLSAAVVIALLFLSIALGLWHP